MKQVFAIRDLKGNFYGSLITCVNEHIAFRIVDQFLSDPKSDYRLYPCDFDLVHLGTFNSVTGELVSLPPSVVLNLKARLDYLQMLYLQQQKIGDDNREDPKDETC